MKEWVWISQLLFRDGGLQLRCTRGGNKVKRRIYQSIGRRLCRVLEDLAGLLKADSRDLEKNA